MTQKRSGPSSAATGKGPSISALRDKVNKTPGLLVGCSPQLVRIERYYHTGSTGDVRPLYREDLSPSVKESETIETQSLCEQFLLAMVDGFEARLPSIEIEPDGKIHLFKYPSTSIYCLMAWYMLSSDPDLNGGAFGFYNAELSNLYYLWTYDTKPNHHTLSRLQARLGIEMGRFQVKEWGEHNRGEVLSYTDRVTVKSAKFTRLPSIKSGDGVFTLRLKGRGY